MIAAKPKQPFFDFFVEVVAGERKKKVEYGVAVDEAYDYYADDAEAVVYLITESGIYSKSCFFVMTRSDAIQFCSCPKSKGIGRGGSWAFAFTTYRRDWRDNLDNFHEDDGRFDGLFSELGITTIYPKKEKKT